MYSISKKKIDKCRKALIKTESPVARFTEGVA